MCRAIKEYSPEVRRYGIENNFQCSFCGNTTAFYINLKLKHDIIINNDGCLTVGLNEKKTKHIFDSINKNIYQMIDKSQMDDKGIFFCANCQEHESVDFQ